MERQERERRYIAEYMKKTWPEGDWLLNVPLGPIPDYLLNSHGPAKAAAIYHPTRPRIDAVKWTDDTYYLIEAKVREIKSGVGDLLFYRGLIPQTRDLPFYDGQELHYRLVVPWSLDWIKAVAHETGIEYAVYWVAWIDDYIRERQHYHTQQYRDQRAEKLRIREMLGVD